MTKATLRLAAVVGVALALWVATTAAQTPTLLASGAAAQEASAAGGGSSNLLTIVFATLGASFGAAALASLGYLLRRQLGLDWHPSSGAASAQEHQEEAATVHHSGADSDHETGGEEP
ncbi:MAG: hypothetical protein ACE5IZ_09665 [Dehalococcoidia bacterium]